MTVLSGQTIRRMQILSPFCEKTTHKCGMTYGLSAAGYDVRIAKSVILKSIGFCIAYTLEKFNMPLNVLGRVSDKSTLARMGLAVQNTIIEPGWRGHLTLELTNHSTDIISINQWEPIAQVIFEFLDEPAEAPYSGKYQDQPAMAVGPLFDKVGITNVDD